MAPKKAAAGKAKAGAKEKAKAKAAPASSNKEVRWLQAQVDVLQSQRQGGPSWLEEPHEWHEEQLNALIERLDSGKLPELPSEVRDGIEFYVGQFDQGSVTQDEFYDDRDIYAGVLVQEEPAAEQPYVRAAATPEAEAAIAELRAWADTNQQGLAKLSKLLQAHEAFASVCEAGITRLGGLLAESREAGTALEGNAAGLAPAFLMPIVVTSMNKHSRDAGVQRVCCSVMRGIVVSEGGLAVVIDAGGPALAVKAMLDHVSDVEVCRSGAGVLYAIIQRTEPTSTERLAVKATEAATALAKALHFHPTDRALDRAVRVTLPELKG